MKINTKLTLAVVTASISFFGLASAATAGEGGAAGAAAFSLNGNQVTGAAVSAAVGKQNAAATATNTTGTVTTRFGQVITTTTTPSTNTATAVGSAGTINIGTITTGADPSLGRSQSNTLNNTPQIIVPIFGN